MPTTARVVRRAQDPGRFVPCKPEMRQVFYSLRRQYDQSRLRRGISCPADQFFANAPPARTSSRLELHLDSPGLSGIGVPIFQIARSTFQAPSACLLSTRSIFPTACAPDGAPFGFMAIRVVPHWNASSPARLSPKPPAPFRSACTSASKRPPSPPAVWRCPLAAA